MFFCGSHSYLKKKLISILENTKPEERKTFLVHTNQMKRYLKEFILENRESLFNAEFFTLIDISKRITGIEPLQDFEREMIFKKFLIKHNLDGLSEEFGLIVQQIKEYNIPVEDIKQPFTKEIIGKYENFKSNRYFDREDTHIKAVKVDTDFQTDHLFIFGIKSVPVLHQKLFRKITQLSKNSYIFLPFHFDSGYYQNYDHFKEVSQFYEEIGGFPEVEKKEDKNIKVSKYIYKFDYSHSQIKNENIQIIKTSDELSELLLVAVEILKLTTKGIPIHKIGIIIPEIEKYIPYIENLFPSFNIPFYLTENSRFIDSPLYSKLFAILELKRNNFSKETVLNILSQELLNIPNINLIEKQILSQSETEGIEIYKHLEPEFYELLETVNSFPDSGSIEDFVSVLNKIRGKFIKNPETKDFLKSVVTEIQDKELFKDLFKKITYEEFISILKTFFLKENKQKRPDYETVQIFSPISAEGNNFSHIFFLNLNSNSLQMPEGVFSLDKIDYPYHLLMQQISNFCALLDRGKKIYLSFTEKSVYGGEKPPSFLIDEIVRITGNKIQVLEGKKLVSQWQKVIYAPLIKNHIPYLKKIEKRIKKIEEPKKENFRLNITVSFPIQPTKLSLYAVCPYRFFLEKMAGFQPEKPVDRKKLPSEKVGEEVHNRLFEFYKKMPETDNDSYIQKNLPKVLKKLKKQLEEYLPQLLPYYRLFEKHRINSLITNIHQFILSDINRLKEKNRTIKKDFLEKKFSDEYFSGRVDRVEVDKNGDYHIYDYKTTEKDINLHKEIKDKYIQLVVYKTLLKEYPVKSIGILAVNSKNGKFFHTLEEKEIHRIEKYLQELLKQLQEGLFPPVENKECNYCPFEYFCPKGVK